MSRGSVAVVWLWRMLWCRSSTPSVEKRASRSDPSPDEQCVSMLGVAKLRVQVRHHQVRSCSALVG